MQEHIPQLRITVDPETGLIRLEQGDGDAHQVLVVHQAHIGYLAERLGLMAPIRAQAAQRAVELAQRMVTLSDRCRHLAERLVNHSAHAVGGLESEAAYAVATVQLGEHFCADFGAEQGGAARAQLSERTHQIAEPAVQVQ